MKGTVILLAILALPTVAQQGDRAAREAAVELQGRQWLSGVFNSLLDEAATLPASERRLAVETTLAQIGSMPPSVRRFQAVFRAVVLEPDDLAAMNALVIVVPEAGQSSDAAPAPLTKRWLAETFRTRSTGPAGVPWKRALRNYLILTGDDAGARQAAKELAAAKTDAQSVRDRIYSAVIERSLGNRVPYDALLARCPAPDADYLGTHPVPPRPTVYCEDLIAEFTKTARERRGATAPPQLAEMFIETNRVAVDRHTPGSGRELEAARTRLPGEADVESFEATVKRLRDEMASLSSAEREQAANAMMGEVDGLQPSMETVLRYVIVDPTRTSGAAGLLRAAGRYPDSAPAVRLRIAAMYERFAGEPGPDQDDWRRGRAAYLLFTGELAQAKELAENLLTRPSRDKTRDVMVHALIARSLGDMKPYTEALAHSETREVRRDTAVAISRYAIRTLSTRTPEAFRAVVREYIQDPTRRSGDRVPLAIVLSLIEPETAAAVLKVLVRNPTLPTGQRLDGYLTLAQTARDLKKWQEGLAWVDALLAELRYQDAPLSLEEWNLPEFTLAAAQGPALYTVPDLCLALALGAKDYPRAQQSVEMLLRTGGQTFQRVSLTLYQLARAEIDAGLRAEPLRILGYIDSHTPQDQIRLAQSLELRKRLGTNNQPADVKPQAAPWEPRQRQPMPKLPPETPDTTVKT
jgi:hypothetical protein